MRMCTPGLRGRMYDNFNKVSCWGSLPPAGFETKEESQTQRGFG